MPSRASCKGPERYQTPEHSIEMIDHWCWLGSQYNSRSYNCWVGDFPSILVRLSAVWSLKCHRSGVSSICTNIKHYIPLKLPYRFNPNAPERPDMFWYDSWIIWLLLHLRRPRAVFIKIKSIPIKLPILFENPLHRVISDTFPIQHLSSSFSTILANVSTMRSFLVFCSVLISAVFTTSLPSSDPVDDVTNEIGFIDDIGISSDIAADPNQDQNHGVNGQQECRAGESFSGQSYGKLRARGRACKTKEPVKNVVPGPSDAPDENDNNNVEEGATESSDQLTPDTKMTSENRCPPGKKGICGETLVKPIDSSIPLVSFSHLREFIPFVMIPQKYYARGVFFINIRLGM